MNNMICDEMLEATRLTRAGHLAEATALLQRALHAKTAPLRKFTAEDDETDVTPALRVLRLKSPTLRTIDATGLYPSADLGTALKSAFSRRPSDRVQDWDWGAATMPEALRGFLKKVGRFDSALELDEWTNTPTAPDVGRDASGQFVTMSFSNDAGHRAYKLFVPSGYHGRKVPLIVMLHGCTQSPDDFAAGTRMNALGEEHTCLVAYPAQAASANISKCWNWFSPGDQQRDQGEPSLIAGITRQVMCDYAVDPRRVYIAGLSAGAAAASIMAMTYPDLYAAVCVHSGLACGAAHDLPSAFAAMRQGGGQAADHLRGFSRSDERRRIVPTIVFHGDRDRTVHPRNGDDVIAQASALSRDGARKRVKQGQVAGGHAYTCTSFVDANGASILEQWMIHGGGHAWSGGSSAGSYTDPRGPDATREMLRFFLAHAHPMAAQ